MVEPKWELVRELEAWGDWKRTGVDGGGVYGSGLGVAQGKTAGKSRRGSLVTVQKRLQEGLVGTCKLDWVIRTCKVGVENGATVRITYLSKKPMMGVC